MAKLITDGGAVHGAVAMAIRILPDNAKCDDSPGRKAEIALRLADGSVWKSTLQTIIPAGSLPSFRAVAWTFVQDQKYAHRAWRWRRVPAAAVTFLFAHSERLFCTWGV